MGRDVLQEQELHDCASGLKDGFGSMQGSVGLTHQLSPALAAAAATLLSCSVLSNPSCRLVGVAPCRE